LSFNYRTKFSVTHNFVNSLLANSNPGVQLPHGKPLWDLVKGIAVAAGASATWTGGSLDKLKIGGDVGAQTQEM
jgi:hypothetical protein